MVATGGSPLTGMGLIGGTAIGRGAQAVTARRVSSKIMEVFIGMLLYLYQVKFIS
jgi:ABC-type uncharacterized transport system permease subunit